MCPALLRLSEGIGDPEQLLGHQRKRSSAEFHCRILDRLGANLNELHEPPVGQPEIQNKY